MFLAMQVLRISAGGRGFPLVLSNANFGLMKGKIRYQRIQSRKASSMPDLLVAS